MKRKILRPVFILVGIVGLAIIAVITSFAVHVRANPLYYMVPQTSATATTTVVYLSSTGQATSTAVDAYTSVNQAVNSISLFVQNAASSTSSVLNVRFQYSYDSIDWYDDEFLPPATSTPATVAVPLSYQWTALGTATSSKVLPSRMPMRYVRAIFTETGAAGAIWYGWQPIREQ